MTLKTDVAGIKVSEVVYGPNLFAKEVKLPSLLCSVCIASFKKMKTLLVKSDVTVPPLNLCRTLSSSSRWRDSAHHVVLPPHECLHSVSFLLLCRVVFSVLLWHRDLCSFLLTVQ